MESINYQELKEKAPDIKADFQTKRPFRYTVLEDFLKEEAAEKIYREFPPVRGGDWVDARGLHTRQKWTQPVVDETQAADFYREAHSSWFLAFLSDVTHIDELVADKGLQGAGFHQTLTGGYLDVHVDFNKHPTNDLDRRLNLIVFLCKNTDPRGGGNLELWDIHQNQRIESIPPVFNRCVLFETNEISYHGHPKPWPGRVGETRKSLSVYYYSNGREDGIPADTHSTLYINTEGLRGVSKVLINGTRDLIRLGPLRRRMRDRKQGVKTSPSNKG